MRPSPYRLASKPPMKSVKAARPSPAMTVQAQSLRPCEPAGVAIYSLPFGPTPIGGKRLLWLSLDRGKLYMRYTSMVDFIDMEAQLLVVTFVIKAIRPHREERG
jgi:hypothetical protein